MVSEMKLNDSFPEGQFLMNGFYSPFRFDRNRNGGGIMLHLRQDTPKNCFKSRFPLWESFFIEITLYKKKWLINCSYNPHKSNIGKHLDMVSRSLDALSTKNNNIALLSDFLHVLMMGLDKHFANFILFIISLNNLHALKIPRTLAALI